MRNGTGIVADMLKGAVAGAAAVWLFDRLDWFMWNHEASEARRRTVAVRPGGEDPAHVIATGLERAAGAELTPSQHWFMGQAVHYAIGMGPAAAYAVVRRRLPQVAAGRGTLFGLSVFLTQDEALNSLTGLAEKPNDYPWQAHARGLVSHLVYGFVTDLVLRTLDGADPSRGAAAAAPGRD